MRETGQFRFPAQIVSYKTRENIDDDFYTKDEQDVNLKKCKRYNFYDLKICEQLCSKIHKEDVALCRQICRSHLSEKGEINEICPFEKLCPAGCPCIYYQCEHVDTNQVPLAWYYQGNDPLFDAIKTTNDETASTTMDQVMFDPSEPAPRLRQVFSRLASVDPKTLKLKQIYERVLFYKFWYNHFYKITPECLKSYRPDFILSLDYNPIIALYLKGRNYLVDPEFNTNMINDEKEALLIDLGVESEAMLSRYGVTNRLMFNGKGSSVAAVFDDHFYFCSTIKYRNYCFYFDPLTRGRKRILEARGRIKSREHDTRKHAFVFNEKLNILSVDSIASHNIQLQRMERRYRDWTVSYYEDPLWEKEFRNDSHGEIVGSQITQLPFDTVINDFYPIPGLESSFKVK
ncbi:Oidioi.mRNA.OKI2018_I69.PAR.g9264.t1.cds [Oikopleura dioica]|uniref:Oidioi.mRNA.OKI2018_I69.PAR.g9264.t1.cds n=1 Tax=Oikopleura dioica TaxID=34765 RepID=A0ABN7RJV8_OIKDI|nr:Oidioi.mRNA.OKI2018_I69.PAR.g9264.t1.cds [Oikopleura dioica]